MMKLSIIGVITILLFGNIFLFVKARTILENNEILKISLEEEKNMSRQNFEDFINFSEEYLRHETLSENKKCKDLVLENSKGEQLSLSDIVNGLPRLFFTFQRANCQICVDEEVIQLQEFAKSQDEIEVVILTNFKNLRLHHLFEEKYQVDTYNINNQYLELEIENTNMPFYTIIDEELITHNVFQPTKMTSNLTSIYLAALKD